MDQLKPGVRIVLTIPGASQQFPKAKESSIVGVLDHHSADSLYVRTVDSLAPTPIPRGLIRGVAVSRGFVPPAENALRKGAIMGALGTVYFALFNELSERNHVSTTTAALTGGIAGLVIGSVLGAFQPRERWQRLTLEPVVSAEFQLGAQLVLSW
jgi:hypothetical protein